MANRNSNTTKGIKTTLTPAERKKLVALELAYSAECIANPRQWLPNDQIITLSESGADASEFGYKGFITEANLGRDLTTASIEDVEAVMKRARGGKGKGKGGNKGGGSQQQLPSAAVAKQVMAPYFAGMTPAGNTGNLMFGVQNALFGSKQKAQTYRDVWEMILAPHHIMMWTEISADFVKELGQAFGYGYWTSRANTRDQAVGIMAHPRLKKIAGPFEYMSVATVQGIPDLRPAFVVVFEDIWSGAIIKVMVNHLKSMRGGAKLTSPVRYQQCVEIVKNHGRATTGIKPALKNQQTRNTWRNQVFGRAILDHGTVTAEMPLCVLEESERKLDLQERIKRGITVMGGDWNCTLDNTTDVDPLIQAGYLLLNAGDNTPTHSMGSRLDGLFAEKENNPSCDASVADGPDEVKVS